MWVLGIQPGSFGRAVSAICSSRGHLETCWGRPSERMDVGYEVVNHGTRFGRCLEGGPMKLVFA